MYLIADDNSQINSVMHIGTIMIFGGILEGVWPNNNQKNVDCATSYARVKVELLDFSHSSITVYTLYKPSRLRAS